jgi:hypothetical protein
MKKPKVVLVPSLISQTAGPTKTVDYEIESSKLKGRFLDYALAYADGHQFIKLTLLPGFTLHRIWVGEDSEHLELWSPTSDPSLASRLVTKHLRREMRNPPHLDLIEIVTQKLGERISVPMLQHGP